MSVCKTSQDIWRECQSNAASVFKEYHLISYSGVPLPDGSDPQGEAEEGVADAIYSHGQNLLETVYRFASRELDETLSEGGEAWARDAYESVLGFLRPMIADEIDATMDYEDQCVREAHELAQEGREP